MTANKTIQAIRAVGEEDVPEAQFNALEQLEIELDAIHRRYQLALEKEEAEARVAEEQAAEADRRARVARERAAEHTEALKRIDRARRR